MSVKPLSSANPPRARKATMTAVNMKNQFSPVAKQTSATRQMAAEQLFEERKLQTGFWFTEDLSKAQQSAFLRWERLPTTGSA